MSTREYFNFFFLNCSVLCESVVIEADDKLEHKYTDKNSLDTRSIAVELRRKKK